jgi:hypothetical protein
MLVINFCQKRFADIGVIFCFGHGKILGINWLLRWACFNEAKIVLINLH